MYLKTCLLIALSIGVIQAKGNVYNSAKPN